VQYPDSFPSRWLAPLRRWGLVPLLAGVLWLAAAICPATASSAPATQAGAQYWMDRSGRVPIEVAQQAFDGGAGLPADPKRVMPLGSDAAVWYRLDLPAVTTPTRAALSMEFAGIDSVELFRADAAGRWQVQRTGDARPVSEWPLRYPKPTFVFTVQPGEREATYLRVRNAQPVRVDWVYETADDLAESAKLSHLAAGAYGGLIVVVVLISLCAAVSWRDPIHLYYTVHVLLVALSVMALTGFAGNYLWPDNAWWNDKAPAVVPALALAWSGLFVRELVAERGQQMVSWLLLAHVAMCLALVAAFLMVGRANVYRAPSVYGLPGMACVFAVLLWYALRRPAVGAWVLAGIGFLTVGALLPALHNLGLLPGSFLVRYGVPVGSALEIPLVLAGLFYRSSERRELRLRSQALAHTDPLTGLANERVLLNTLGQLLRDAKRDPRLGAVLRVQVRNLQDLRAEYGREAAEAALLRAAECVAAEAREGDLVARDQGHDLLLVVAGQVTPNQAMEAGRDIIARGLKFSARLPPNTTLSLSIAGACAPLPDTDPAGLTQALARLAADIANDPRGRAMRFLDQA